MNPKYSLGEIVILQSRSLPEYNGEYLVQNIYKPGEIKISKCGTRHVVSKNIFTYCLGFDYDWQGAILETWGEPALRKKHEPSQMSFQSLIQSINSPVKQES